MELEDREHSFESEDSGTPEELDEELQEERENDSKHISVGVKRLLTTYN